VNVKRAGTLEVDALLYRTMQEISANRLGPALTEIDKVIGTYPNFRLAHLIKGDLLLARRQPITMVGNAEHAPQARVEELRDEARVRLARYHQTRPGDLVPRYLVQLDAEQRHALVVDTSKSTLYVFEHRNGELRYVADYYTTIGKNGIDKNREGDQKTPLGVYHVTSSIRARSSPTSTVPRRSHQLPQRVGPPSGPQRVRHLAARHAVGHLQPSATRERRVRGADQPGSRSDCQ
jgi:hypothetical protein